MMLIKEFISETNKNQMISTLLNHYKVGSVKVKQKSMKDHAHFNVDTGTLELSTRYKTIKNNRLQKESEVEVKSTEPVTKTKVKPKPKNKVSKKRPTKNLKNIRKPRGKFL